MKSFIRIDATFARLLSEFFLDIAKAYFIGTFVTTSISGVFSLPDFLLILTKGIGNVIVFLWLAWIFAKLKERK